MSDTFIKGTSLRANAAANSANFNKRIEYARRILEDACRIAPNTIVKNIVVKSLHDLEPLT